MKFRVTMKDPDTLDDALREAVGLEVADAGHADEEELEAVEEIRVKRTRNLCSKWFEYGEYLTVEIDTEAGTCTVVPRTT